MILDKLSNPVLYIGCVLSTVILVLIFFNPGYMNVDTLDMWGQATHAIPYRDWHSVPMAVLWSGMRHIYSGPQTMLVLEIMLFSTGLFLILGGVAECWKLALAFFTVVLFPPVFAYLGTIGKDSLLADSLIGTVGLVHWYMRSGSRLPFYVALVTSLLAFCVRQNAVFALLPLLFLLFWNTLARSKFRVLKTLTLMLACFGTFSLVNEGVKRLVHAESFYEYQAIPLYDMAALSKDLNVNFIPAEFLSPAGSLRNIRRHTNTIYVNTLIWPWGADNPLQFSSDPKTVHKLLRSWLRIVLRHPLSYLHWRAEVLAAIGGLNPIVPVPYLEGVSPNPAGIALQQTRFTLAEQQFLHRIGHSLLFRGYFYIGLLVIAIGWEIYTRHRVNAAIAMSGIAFFFAYFFIGVNSEFRFVCYTMFLAVAMITKVVVDVINKGTDTGSLWARASVPHVKNENRVTDTSVNA